jgi:uncharacterized RDD family membrane protein YckC
MIVCIVFVLSIGYIPLKDGIYDGQSLGKMFVGLKTVDFVDKKRACGLKESFKRNLIMIIPFIGPLYEVFQIHGNELKRRSGDRFANTIVLDLNRSRVAL